MPIDNLEEIYDEIQDDALYDDNIIHIYSDKSIGSTKKQGSKQLYSYSYIRIRWKLKRTMKTRHSKMKTK